MLINSKYIINCNDDIKYVRSGGGWAHVRVQRGGGAATHGVVQSNV